MDLNLGYNGFLINKTLPSNFPKAHCFLFTLSCKRSTSTIPSETQPFMELIIKHHCKGFRTNEGIPRGPCGPKKTLQNTHNEWNQTKTVRTSYKQLSNNQSLLQVVTYLPHLLLAGGDYDNGDVDGENLFSRCIFACPCWEKFPSHLQCEP